MIKPDFITSDILLSDPCCDIQNIGNYNYYKRFINALNNLDTGDQPLDNIYITNNEKNFILDHKYVKTVTVINSINPMYDFANSSIENLNEFICEIYGHSTIAIAYDMDAIYCFIINTTTSRDDIGILLADTGQNVSIMRYNENTEEWEEYNNTSHTEVNITKHKVLILKKEYQNIINENIDNTIERPDFITPNLLKNYKNNTCKLFGFLGNVGTSDGTRNIPVMPVSFFESLKNDLHIDYLISHFRHSEYLNNLKLCLANADESNTGIKILESFWTFTTSKWLEESYLNQVVNYESFGGVKWHDEPDVPNAQEYIEETTDNQGNIIPGHWQAKSRTNYTEVSTKLYPAYKKYNDNRINNDLDPLSYHMIYHSNGFCFTHKIITEEYPQGKYYNLWNTDETYSQYINDYQPYISNICADFYIFITGKSNVLEFTDRSVQGATTWHPLIVRSRKWNWIEYLHQLLQLHKLYPEKPFELYIHSGHHIDVKDNGDLVDQVLPITYETLAIQSYAKTAIGCTGIGYFLISDTVIDNNDLISQNGGYLDCPYDFNYNPRDNNSEYENKTFEILKSFNNSKFKYIKDFTTKLYIDDVDIYTNNKSKIHTIKQYYNKFINNLEGEALISIGFDKEATYCIIVNLRISNDTHPNAIITLNNSINDIYEVIFNNNNENISYDNNKQTITIIPGDICILKKYYSNPANVPEYNGHTYDLSDLKTHLYSYEFETKSAEELLEYLDNIESQIDYTKDNLILLCDNTNNSQYILYKSKLQSNDISEENYPLINYFWPTQKRLHLIQDEEFVYTNDIIEFNKLRFTNDPNRENKLNKKNHKYTTYSSNINNSNYKYIGNYKELQENIENDINEHFDLYISSKNQSLNNIHSNQITNYSLSQIASHNLIFDKNEKFDNIKGTGQNSFSYINW